MEKLIIPTLPNILNMIGIGIIYCFCDWNYD